MYCIDGEIAVRKRPELLVGDFGLFYEDTVMTPDGPVDVKLRATGSRADVEAARESWYQLHGIDVTGLPEHIDSIAAAVKYTPPREEVIGAETKHRPKLLDVIHAGIPDDTELLAATVGLWEEVRKRTSRRYSFATGTLLALLGYTADYGWHPVHHHVSGNRTVRGPVTPRGHNIHVVTHIEGRDYDPDSRLPYVTVTDIKAKSGKKDYPRYSNISKDVRKMNRAAA